LYKTLSDDDLRRIFMETRSLEGAARRLVSEALECGSDDNISVALVEFGQIPRAGEQPTVPLQFTPEPDAAHVDAAVQSEEAAPAGPRAAVPEGDMPSGPPAAPENEPARHPIVDEPPGPPVGLILAAVTVVVVLFALLTL
jgi:hypothetical protein